MRTITTAGALARNWSSVPLLVSTMARFTREDRESSPKAPSSRLSPQRAAAARVSSRVGRIYRSCIRWLRVNTAAP